MAKISNHNIVTMLKAVIVGRLNYCDPKKTQQQRHSKKDS